MITHPVLARERPEMSMDPRFRRRLRRLVVVSAVMLGAITLLVVVSTDSPGVAVALLTGGWLLMPTLLFVGMDRPGARYLLALPATLVVAGLIVVATSFEGTATALAGWWAITAGVLVGGTLGTWFWYRWMPVPESLDDPFSAGRIGLIAVHVGLILVGMGLVITG